MMPTRRTVEELLDAVSPEARDIDPSDDLPVSAIAAADLDVPAYVPLDMGWSCAERIRRVMQAIGGITKDGEYAAGNTRYNYRGIEQITPRVRDAMIDYGLILVPVRADMTCTPRVKADDKVSVMAEAHMTYRFVNCDRPEDFIETQMIASAVDSGDKYVTKALTSAFKYLMLQSLCIGDPSDDQDRYDADNDAGDALTDEDIAALRVSWDATEDEVGALRAATAMLSDHSREVFAAWWKATGVGSLKEGHVNGRQVPAALHLVQVLLDEEQRAADDAAADPM